MVNDSSLPNDTNSFLFDLDSQKGTAYLLASIRASGLSSEHKNELRDLVFLYANGGRDQSVRLTLEQKIVYHKVTPLPIIKEVVPDPTPVYPFGTSRPIPNNFSANLSKLVTPTTSIPQLVIPTPTPILTSVESAVTPSELPKETDPVEASVPTDGPAPEAPLSSDSLPDEEPHSEPLPSPAPIVETPSEDPEPLPEPTYTEPLAPPPPTTPSVEEEPEQLPVSQPPTPEVEPLQIDPEVSLRRIKEIKASVNDQVGNPVNLIDINNEVGREYMGALLDAMKKINSGSPANSAMKRLELAYQKVQETLDAEALNDKEVDRDPEPDFMPPVTTIPTPTTEVDVAPTEIDEPIAYTRQVPITKLSAEPSNQPIPRPADHPASHSQQSDSDRLSFTPAPTRKEPEPVSETRQADSFLSLRDQLYAPEKPSPSNTYPAPTPISTASPIPPKISSAVSNNPEPATMPHFNRPILGQNNSPQATPSVEHIDAPKLRDSVVPLSASKDRLLTPADLPMASDIESSTVVGDPLFTQEVSNGLHQLLSDWHIFKKSGLFGSGPKGMQHPLFVKLANTQIPLILAGRFEGATQEVKQSITDYMNGWRYEQGIIYEQGETFEHYLRRIIRHILDLQKQKPTP